MEREVNQTLIIHGVESGTSAAINITPLGSGNTPEVYKSEGKGLAAVLWAFLPEETMEALREQLNSFEDERRVKYALDRLNMDAPQLPGLEA